MQLEPLTVLVGRNGSGKSSFVDAVKLVRDALRVGLENAIIERHGFGSICRHTGAGKKNIFIGLTVESEGTSGVYELELGSVRDGFKIVREKMYSRAQRPQVTGRGKERTVVMKEVEERFERLGRRWVVKPRENPISYAQRDGVGLNPTELALMALRFYVPSYEFVQQLTGNFYTIFPNTLRQPQKPMNDQILSDYGDNFGSVLQHLTGRAKTKREIIDVLKRVVEGVSDLRVSSAGGFLVGELQHDDFRNSEDGRRKIAPWFDLSQESDGTLRMLGLLTALYQSEAHRQNPLLALEEPEIALHPGALAILADELQAASKRRPILVTTQSPDLIARFPAQCLRVVEKIGGVTRIAPLEGEQRQIINDQLFNAGDLLRVEGLRGARPTEESEEKEALAAR